MFLALCMREEADGQMRKNGILRGGAGMQKAVPCPIPVLSGKNLSLFPFPMSLWFFLLVLSSEDTGVSVSF